MNWTLREKTEKETNDMKALMRSYKNYNPEVCPLEVTKSNGEVKDVWDLSSNEIGGLIEQISRELEKGNKDNQRIMWAGQIVRCWDDRHKSLSPRVVANLMRVQQNVSNPANREIVKDVMGGLGQETIHNANVIAKYLNGMNGNNQAPTDAQILQVLENIANMQEMSSSQNR